MTCAVGHPESAMCWVMACPDDGEHYHSPTPEASERTVKAHLALHDVRGTSRPILAMEHAARGPGCPRCPR